MRKILGALISLLVSTNISGQQISDTLLDINSYSKDCEVYFRTTYWDHYIEGEGGVIPEFQGDIDMKLSYFADNEFTLSLVKNTFITDSVDVHCFCGWDFEILTIKFDTIISKDKYVFCCNEFFNGYYIDSLKVSELIHQLDTVKIKSYEFTDLDSARSFYESCKNHPYYISALTDEPVWFNNEGYFTFYIMADKFTEGYLNTIDYLENHHKGDRYTFKRLFITEEVGDGYKTINKIICDRSFYDMFNQSIVVDQWQPFQKEANYSFTVNWKKNPDSKLLQSCGKD